MTILYGILGLGLIVFIHELGHFIAARSCGVEVETFSIGMGPVLLHKKVGQTDYRLSLIPLGGYCGMKGEKMFQEAIEAGMDSIPKEENSFYGVSPFKRIIIAFAGPAFNVIFASISLSIIAMIGYNYYTTPSKIILANEVYADMNSVAKEAGLLTGDIITKIDEQPIKYFSDISTIVATSPQEELLFEILRNETIYEFKITPELEVSTGAGKIGVMSWVDPVIHSVTKGSSSDNAQLIHGDIITKVEGYLVNNTVDFTKIIQNRESVMIEYERNDQSHTTILEFSKSEDGTLDYTNIGITWKIEEVSTQKYSFFPALLTGFNDTIELIQLTFKSISLLFKGVDLTKAVSGPIGITMMLGETTQESFEVGFFIGIVAVLNFLSLISVSLFIMNLLPIPILDGGLILFSLIEIIRGKAIKPAILYKVQFVGIGFILFLFVIGFIGDINKLVTGSF